MRVIVTGGAGFIGTHLIRRLRKTAGLEITNIDNLTRGQHTLPDVAPLYRFTHASLDSVEPLMEAFYGSGVVIHLASEARVLSAELNPAACYRSNVTGTYNVLSAAKEAKVGRVVFASSREVYGDSPMLPVSEYASLVPKNVYGRSKMAAEQYCRAFIDSGLEVNILRFGNVYGPGDQDRVIPRFIHQAESGAPITVWGGEQVLDLLWIEYAVDALVQAAFGPALSSPVNVASGRGTTVLELAKRIMALAASTSELIVSPQPAQEVTHFIADVTQARALLGLPFIEDPLAQLPQMIRPDDHPFLIDSATYAVA